MLFIYCFIGLNVPLRRSQSNLGRSTQPVIPPKQWSHSTVFTAITHSSNVFVWPIHVTRAAIYTHNTEPRWLQENAIINIQYELYYFNKAYTLVLYK